MAETILYPDFAIEKQISDILKDINGVFFTHLHFDHTSGLPALPDHLLYIAGKGEKSPSSKWLLESNHFKKNDLIYLLDFSSELAQKEPFGNAIDIFGDQSLWAMSTPGHSKGHVSYLVNTKENPILIAGDAVTTNMSMELAVGPGTASDNIEVAQKTFDRIYRFVNEHPEVTMWPGHDFPVSK